MIEFRDVSFFYAGSASGVEVPALRVGPGLALVVGPNGAGKSTLLRLAAGVERPATGAVTICGHDLWTAEVDARRALAYVPEQPELTPYATIEEVVRLAAGLRGLTVADARAALDRVGLTSFGHRTVRELSMGQRRRAVFATALLGEPPVLLLDEPLETMDLAMRRTVADLVRARRSAGGTVLLATHEIEPFAADVDVVIAMHGGRARVEAAPSGQSVAQRVSWIESLALNAGAAGEPRRPLHGLTADAGTGTASRA